MVLVVLLNSVPYTEYPGPFIRQPAPVAGAPEESMRGLGGLVGLIVVAAIAGLIYKNNASPTGANGGATAISAITSVGVENDLIQIAQAERAYEAEHGSYAPLDELTLSDAMSVHKSGRDGYKYESVLSANGFRIIARCSTFARSGCRDYFVDETMEVQPYTEPDPDAPPQPAPEPPADDN